MAKRLARRLPRRKQSSDSSSDPCPDPDLPSNEFLVSNYEPYRLLDIQRGMDEKDFSFVVVFTSILNQNAKKNFKLHNLDFLTERYRMWLLSLFKKNLKDLSTIKNMKNWAMSRISLLKDYCSQQKINFEGLYFRSTLPPTQVYSSQPAIRTRKKSVDFCEEPQKADRLNAFSLRKKKIKKTRNLKVKACCKSLNESFNEENTKNQHTVKSKATLIRNLNKKLNHYLEKYEKMEGDSLSKEEFLRDINELRNYF